MDIQRLAIPDVCILKPAVHGDARGFFVETYNKKTFEAATGLTGDQAPTFVQDNMSLSGARYTLRGLHLQHAPFAQAKLVTALQGRIWDVAVDVRPDSPTFGQHVSFEIAAEDHAYIYVPAGFAHGFLTLEENTLVQYKVTDFYHKESEAGIAWNDTDLNIPWPLEGNTPTLSDKDKVAQRFEAFKQTL